MAANPWTGLMSREHYLLFAGWRWTEAQRAARTWADDRLRARCRFMGWR